MAHAPLDCPDGWLPVANPSAQREPQGQNGRTVGSMSPRTNQKVEAASPSHANTLMRSTSHFQATGSNKKAAGHPWTDLAPPHRASQSHHTVWATQKAIHAPADIAREGSRRQLRRPGVGSGAHQPLDCSGSWRPISHLKVKGFEISLRVNTHCATVHAFSSFRPSSRALRSRVHFPRFPGSLPPGFGLEAGEPPVHVGIWPGPASG